jgi:hypothetical protein
LVIDMGLTSGYIDFHDDVDAGVGPHQMVLE